MRCSGFDTGPENKMLNRSVMGLVGEIWMSVDSVIIIGKCFDVDVNEHYNMLYILYYVIIC